jgi:hypothetical protein
MKVASTQKLLFKDFLKRRQVFLLVSLLKDKHRKDNHVYLIIFSVFIIASVE